MLSFQLPVRPDEVHSSGWKLVFKNNQCTVPENTTVLQNYWNCFFLMGTLHKHLQLQNHVTQRKKDIVILRLAVKEIEEALSEIVRTKVTFSGEKRRRKRKYICNSTFSKKILKISLSIITKSKLQMEDHLYHQGNHNHHQWYLQYNQMINKQVNPRNNQWYPQAQPAPALNSSHLNQNLQEKQIKKRSIFIKKKWLDGHSCISRRCRSKKILFDIGWRSKTVVWITQTHSSRLVWSASSIQVAILQIGNTREQLFHALRSFPLW